jgi:hypothetical protein
MLDHPSLIAGRLWTCVLKGYSFPFLYLSFVNPPPFPTPTSSDVGDAVAFEPHAADAFTKGLEALPNGVLRTGDGFPHDVRASVNLGALKIRMSDSGTLAADLGWLMRSFKLEDIYAINRERVGYLKKMWPEAFRSALHFTSGSIVPPWLSPPNNPLLQLARQSTPVEYKENLAAGGVEPSILVKMFPHLLPIVIAFPIKGAHTDGEQMDLIVGKETTNWLPGYLGKIAELEVSSCAGGIMSSPIPPNPYSLLRSIEP